MSLFGVASLDSGDNCQYARWRPCFGRAKWRYNIFCSELSLALEAIRFGDKTFFDHDPKLDQVPILVHFKSTDEKYNKTEKWGSPGDYNL
jgi:hypothetical protein